MSKQNEANLKVECNSFSSKLSIALTENEEWREELERGRTQLKECQDELKDKTNE